MARFDVNRHTIREAFVHLDELGFVERVPEGCGFPLMLDISMSAVAGGKLPLGDHRGLACP